MKILVTGICGFVGSQLALRLGRLIEGCEITGIDNLLRPGSELNRTLLAHRGVRFLHGDLRLSSDLAAIGSCDWVIDAAAHPSVLAGVDGRSSPRQLLEHNLVGTLNVLEYCREHRAGLILLSTSRVYSVRDLAALPVVECNQAFTVDDANTQLPAVSSRGITEEFPVSQPISLYGATKLSSEIMAREYGQAFDFPVWINRCGVLAGAGQFGTAEQGIFSYWIHAHRSRLPLRYIGFGGRGFQVRDALHPDDLAGLISIQLRRTPLGHAAYHASGGAQNSMSLSQLTTWCDRRFGDHVPQPDDRPRKFDIPWLIMDSHLAEQELGWRPKRSLSSILEEIALHAVENPDWLRCTGAI